MDKMHMHTFNAQLLTKYQSIKVQEWAFPEVESTDNNHFTRLICTIAISDGSLKAIEFMT